MPDIAMSLAPWGTPDMFALGPNSELCVGAHLSADGDTSASRAWLTASLAVFYPFVITQSRTYGGAIWINGATLSGNVDVGIYTTAGTRKASLGSTAQSGISAAQKASFSGGNVTLTPGRYFLAMVADNTTATFWSTSPNTTPLRSAGIMQMASAFALPASATIIALAQAVLVPSVVVFEAGVNWL